MKTYLLRGVPASIRRDGWWIEGIDAPQRRRRTKPGIRRARFALLLMLALTLLMYFGEESFPAGDPSHSLGADSPIE